MAKQPGKMYRNLKGQAYTRREYMGGVPGSRVVHYDMGGAKNDFKVELTLVADEQCHVRDVALESARISANRLMSRDIGSGNYHFKLRVQPHHVLRMNKQATGAGADRVSDGMRHAFGKAIGTAARVNRGQRIMTVGTHPQHFLKAKDALRKAKNKLPTPCSIIVERGSEYIS